MKQAKVITIGENSLDPSEKIILLFGEKATEELRKVSVIQKMAETDQLIQLAEGGRIKFDNQEYKINHVGQLANENLNTISHMAIVFDKVPTEDRLLNAVYVEPFDFPKILEGTIISYQ